MCKNSPPFERLTCIFLWKSLKILNVFNTLTLKKIFWRTKTFLKKLEHCFLVERTMIENTSFPYKTAKPKGNVKTNKWWLQNGPITNNRLSPVTNLSFWKYCFSLRTCYKELIWCIKNQNAHICTSCKHWSFIWLCFFLWVSLSQFLFLISFSTNRMSSFNEFHNGGNKTTLVRMQSQQQDY